MISKDLTLNDTVELMNSPDYKERFCAEYIQTKIRYERLKAFNTRIEAAIETRGTENAVEMPKHDVPLHILRQQQHAMGEYLCQLEVRAVIEGIDLDVAIKNCAMRVGETSGVYVKNCAILVNDASEVCAGVYGPEVKNCSCATETEVQ